MCFFNFRYTWAVWGNKNVNVFTGRGNEKDKTRNGNDRTGNSGRT
jgi:hypothetical protein